MADFIYLLIYKFVKFIAFLPFGDKIFKFIAFCFFKLDFKHTRIMRVNLGFCFPNLNDFEAYKIIAQTYENFAFFASEFFKNQSLDKEQILKKANLINEDYLLDALNSGRPIIVQTAHYGNWEFFSLAMAAKFGKVSIIGRNLDSKVMDKILSEQRRKFDIELIPKKGSAKQILSALNSKRRLGVLVDQNAGNDGIECQFFGKKISHTPAVSIFAKKTNALIIPAFARRNDKNPNLIDIIFFEPIDVNLLGDDAIKIATQMQSDATQKIISQKPDEYFWMHKKFKHFYEEIYL